MPTHRRPLAALLTTALALAAAGSAQAQDGHSLTLTGPPTAQVGEPTVLQAAGTVPEDVFLQRYVNVYAIPTSVAATCPGTFQGAMQLSDASSAQGGFTVALAVPAETGSFQMPIAYTPQVAGSFVLCGYLHEMSETLATASHAISVAGRAAGADAPRNTKKPKVTRSGKHLVCGRGRWAGAPTAFAYAWRVDGRTRAGATKRRLRVTRALRGHRVRCAVTATNAAGARTALSGSVRVR